MTNLLPGHVSLTMHSLIKVGLHGFFTTTTHISPSPSTPANFERKCTYKADTHSRIRTSENTSLYDPLTMYPNQKLMRLLLQFISPRTLAHLSWSVDPAQMKGTSLDLCPWLCPRKDTSPCPPSL